MTDLNKQELRRLAEAATPGPWDWGGTQVSTQEQALDICLENIRLTEAPGPYFCEVYVGDGRRTALVGHGPTSQQNAAFIAAANPAVILAMLDENEELREELGGLRNVSTETVKALKRLVMHARTTGGTAGPDAALMDACEQAEKMLSLGGIGRAYMDGADAVASQEDGHE